MKKLCMETLMDGANGRWQLTISPYDSAVPLIPADVYVWDMAGAKIWSGVEAAAEGAEHVFLVESGQIDELKRFGDKTFRVFLKPVNRMLLRSSIEEASRRGRSGHMDSDAMIEFLMEMNVRLQKYDHARNQLFSQILNDFSDPLMAIDGYCDLLVDRKLGPLNPEQAMAIQHMKQSVKRLSRLSASVPQLAGGDTIRLMPRLVPGDIEECIGQAVREVKAVAENRKLNIRVQTSLPEGKFWFDQSQIEQMFATLLDATCRYCPKGGTIQIQGNPVFWDRRIPNLVEVRAHSDRRRLGSPQVPNAYQLVVTASGEGFVAEDFEELFENFSNAGTPSNGSMLAGIGMAVCKQTVNRHGGRISAHCSAEGSRVVILMPLTQQPSKVVNKATGFSDTREARAFTN